MFLHFLQKIQGPWSFESLTCWSPEDFSGRVYSGGPMSQSLKKPEGGAGESGFFCSVCCTDWYIKIPPIIVCQDLVCHLVTDFAIRYLCCPCMLKNPANFRRTLLLLSHLKDLLWLMGTEDFALTPVFQSHGNLRLLLPQMPAFGIFSSSMVCLLSLEYLWYVAMQWDIPSQLHSGTCSLWWELVQALKHREILLQKLLSLWVEGGLTPGAVTSIFICVYIQWVALVNHAS